MPTFVHDGLILRYEETGAGAPVIFLAGIMGDPVGEGSSGAAGTALDHDGNRDIGNNSVARRDYSVREMARDVLALMGHLELERASIVGHSLGGKIAQEMALLAPARGQTGVGEYLGQDDAESRSLMELWISLREEVADSLVFAQMICFCVMGPDALAQYPLREATVTWMRRTELQRGPAFIRNVEASLAATRWGGSVISRRLRS